MSMEKHDPLYAAYIRILEAELIPATGCTEPIAIAYAAAKARAVLGTLPESCLVEASGNIIKNVKSVVVPNTGHMRGIPAAASAGIVAGDADAQLQVISRVSPEAREQIKVYCDTHTIQVVPAHNGKVFYIAITVKAGDSSVRVVIEEFHTNITRIEKDGVCLFSQESTGAQAEQPNAEAPHYEWLSVEKILEFADSVDLKDVEEVLSRQIAYNSAISQEGLKNPWGAQIGRTLLKERGDDIRVRARAMAAAGSDARMSGCELPVVINSGSGNQGITVSVPVIEYARELGASDETLCRALALSNLIAIHEKAGIGRLSAYCGAVSAGCAAGCGIAYLQGADLKAVSHTLVNALAIVSGIICDGAKASCAAKIASSVEAGILGYHMYKNGQQFRSGDGIVTKGVENTIRNVGLLGREGMRETDKEIVRIMLQEP